MIKRYFALSDQNSITWKILLVFNAVVLFLFWFGILSDYSLYNNWVSFSFSILVLIVSVVSFIMSLLLDVLQRVIILLICLLSFLFAVASIPLHRYHSHQTSVKNEISPDGKKTAAMYCETDNAHGGMDHIEIIVRYTKFPFVQRDLGLYNNFPSRNCAFDTSSPIFWVDNDTVYVRERQAHLDVGVIKWEGVLENPGEINGSN